MIFLSYESVFQIADVVATNVATAPASLIAQAEKNAAMPLLSPVNDEGNKYEECLACQ
jgi:hypothetical protein